MRILFFSGAMPSFFSPAVPGDSYVTGGWITGTIESLLSVREVELCCAFPYPAGGSMPSGTYRGVRYAGLPVRYGFSGEENDAGAEACGTLLDVFRPDVVQIFGTESASCLPLLAAAASRGIGGRTAVHIQGLCGAIAGCYTAGLPGRVCRFATPRDLIRHDSILRQQDGFLLRAEAEKKIFAACAYAFGRTEFDRREAERLHPGIAYRKVPEAMRPSFYASEWTREGAVPHRLLLSQGGYPLKGLHVLLEALPRILSRFPDTTLHIAGGDPTRSAEGIRGRMLIGSYGAYILRLIRRLGLRNAVRFTGTLDEPRMLSEYLCSECLVSSSVLENSPNSVAEAMLLGLPVIATRTGGTPDVLPEGCGRLVPPLDAGAIAEAVLRAFSDPNETDRLRLSAREHALQAHDPAACREALLTAYREMLSNGTS